VIRKGDYFGIYIDITNGYDSPILISEIKLVAPMGFSQPKKDKKKQEEESSGSGTRMSTQQGLVETIHLLLKGLNILVTQGVFKTFR
jgi:hypothetical protein